MIQLCPYLAQSTAIQPFRLIETETLSLLLHLRAMNRLVLAARRPIWQLFGLDTVDSKTGSTTR
jgi:hypothetical protein